MDLTLAKHLNSFGNLGWETVGLHGSDHHPIVSKWGVHDDSELGTPIDDSCDKIRYMYDKANWEQFNTDALKVDWGVCTDENLNTYRDNIINRLTEISKCNIPYKEINQKYLEYRFSLPSIHWPI